LLSVAGGSNHIESCLDLSAITAASLAFTSFEASVSGCFSHVVPEPHRFCVQGGDFISKDTEEMCADNIVAWKWITIVATALVLVGGLNWLSVGVAQKDLVAAVLGKGLLARAVYVLVGLSAVFLFFRRDTYLPFLAPTVFPVGALTLKTPQGASEEVTVRTVPNAKVVYWASEPSRGEPLGDYKVAYDKYDNAGVAVADAQGDVKLKVRTPRSYLVPLKGELKPHVHFRVIGENGWAGRVETTFLGTGKVEAFADLL
jgi:uncharacterized membrane protein YuzA (DUF378 family)